MELGNVYHRTSDNYCYAFNEDELIINLKTGYDVERVFIYQGDPYLAGIMGGSEKWQGQREEIFYKKRLKNHIWWTTTLRPPYKRCKYFFELQTKDETLYYFEDGFYSQAEIEHQGKSLSYFIMPWMNPADVMKTPSWVNEVCWYQIFPERFCNGNPKNDPPNTRPWKYEKTRFWDYYGGDIEGITKKLDYLENLGITGLYLTPVFEADSNHKYNTKDYKKVDSCFGTNQELKNLVRRAHDKGMRIMFDGVFNHTGTDFPYWQDILEKGKESPYFDWYMIQDWPIDQEKNTEDGRFYSFAFSEKMPKLNTNNPEVIQYLLDVVEYWIDEFDIDALRLDVANEVSHKFCKALRQMIKEKKSDFYLLGEIWHDSIPWLQGDEYDAVMNYPLASGISDFWLYEEWGKEEFEYSVNRCFTMYKQQCNDVLFNLLDSHDTNRLMDKVKDKDVFYQQLAVLYTMPGSPCIYYGTEIAMEGSYDPDCRRCMPWEDISEGRFESEINQIKDLIRLRKKYPVARSRNFHFPCEIENSRVVEYQKLLDGEIIEVVLNCGTQSVKLEKQGEIVYSRKYREHTLEPKGVVVYHRIL